MSITTPTRTPMLPPSPLSLGQTLTATLAVFSRRISRFIALALLPGVAVALVLVIGTIVATIAMLTAAGSTLWRTEWTPASTASVFAVILVAAVLTPLIQIKGHSTLVFLAHETALDRRPTVSEVINGTKGVVRRSLALVALALVLLPVVGLAALLMTGVATIGPGPAMWGAPWPAVVGVAAMAAVAALVMARLLYVPQGVTIERLGGLRSLAYSWHLTGRARARTLGWFLAGPALGSFAFWVVAGALTTLMGGGPNTAVQVSDAVLALPLYLAAYTFSTLFTAIFATVMHVDQRRR